MHFLSLYHFIGASLLPAAALVVVAAAMVVLVPLVVMLAVMEKFGLASWLGPVGVPPKAAAKTSLSE